MPPTLLSSEAKANRRTRADPADARPDRHHETIVKIRVRLIGEARESGLLLLGSLLFAAIAFVWVDRRRPY